VNSTGDFKRTNNKPRTTLYDTIILGAGPAGLSAAIYAARKLLKTLVVSQNIGGQVAYYYDLDNYLVLVR